MQIIAPNGARTSSTLSDGKIHQAARNGEYSRIYFYSLGRLVGDPSGDLNAAVCDRSLAGIADSNPVGDMDACLFWVLCVIACDVEEEAAQARVGL
jgi:hypothetical protein